MDSNSKQIKNSFTSANTFPAKLLHCKSIIGDKIIPVHIQLCPTNKCNLNCSFCSCKNRSKKDTLSLSDIKEIILKYKLIGTKAVTITGGGEPLMHPYIDKIFEFINSHGIKIGLVTNGTQFRNISKNILKPITWCRISISDDRKLNYREIPTDIRIDWSFSYVVTKKPDYKNIIQIIQFANKNNFTHVRLVSDLLEIEKAPDMKKIKQILSDHQIPDNLVIYQGRKEYFPGAKKCLISLLKPVIAPDGFIYPCCGVQYALKNPSKDFEPKMVLGHIDEIDNMYFDQRYFNGENCIKCYYSDYNNALDLLTQKLIHLDFV